MMYWTLFLYALSCASLFTPSWSSRISNTPQVRLTDSDEDEQLLKVVAETLSTINPSAFTANASLTNAEKLLVKAFYNLQLGKPDKVAEEIGQINAEAGKQWAADMVSSLQKRMDKEGHHGDNFNKLRDAHYFAKKLLTVAKNASNYKELQAEEVSEELREFTERENVYVLHSDFGNEVIRVRTMLFEQAAGVGLDVRSKEVQTGISSFAPMLASAGYDTQLGTHQNSYGAYNSSKK
eukprot:TRINITY_DN2073_c0_g1_i1.p1 TRINITY_DN2073_c0_g1~~TRINITY_DN2073_c0_g1_i1.p1  ORF type:complete len:258 (+),score=47.02 TRINITY_DN2073_c0_g1_i1:66-776(+)